MLPLWARRGEHEPAREGAMRGARVGGHMAPRIVVLGIVLSVLIVLFGAFSFVQTKDPALLIFALQPVAWMWAILLVVHVLTRGIPVRIVADERKGP